MSQAEGSGQLGPLGFRGPSPAEEFCEPFSQGPLREPKVARLSPGAWP